MHLIGPALNSQAMPTVLPRRSIRGTAKLSKKISRFSVGSAATFRGRVDPRPEVFYPLPVDHTREKASSTHESTSRAVVDGISNGPHCENELLHLRGRLMARNPTLRGPFFSWGMSLVFATQILYSVPILRTYRLCGALPLSFCNCPRYPCSASSTQH